MKISIDIDDCICNTLEFDFASIYKYNKERGVKVDILMESNTHYVPDLYGYEQDKAEEFFMEEKQYIMKHTSMSPKPYVKDVIDLLIKDGHEIIFLTARDNKFWNGNAYKYARRWLKKHRIRYSSLVINTSDKSVFCKENNVDLLIEDNKNTVDLANKKGIRTVLIYQVYNKDYSHELNTFASCWPHVYDIVSELTHNI